jgi:tRNA threonylcarbamoyladenosine biosynthesis protein TsaE
MLLLRSDSVATTQAIAGAIARLAHVGDVVVLAGDMGAGKTAFAQGFGHELGVTEPITSPTFTLVHSYRLPGKLTLHHADLYRLDRTEEVTDLALAELAEFGGIVLVEWGDVVAASLGDHLEVRLLFEEDLLEPSVGHDVADTSPEDGLTVDDDATGASTDADADAGDSARTIEISATGPAWASRWDRVVQAVARFR